MSLIPSLPTPQMTVATSLVNPQLCSVPLSASMSGTQVLRLAARYEPATIVVEYKRDSEEGKLRHLEIKLKNVATARELRIVAALQKRFPDLLGPEVVSPKQLKGLVSRVKSKVLELEGTDTMERAALEDRDLNKADDEEVKRAKEKMDVLFKKNQVLPGDEGYQYDKQVEFKEGTENNSWDEDEDDDEDEDYEDDEL